MFDDVSSWFFVPIGVQQNVGLSIRTFFMSQDHSDVYHYNERKTREQVCGLRLNLPRKTLVYGEIVKELSGEGKAGKAQTCIYAFHIIDAIMLGGTDIRSFPLKKRLLMCKKFAKAVSQPDKTELTPIRCKDLIPIGDMRTFFNGMSVYKLKDGQSRPGLVTSSTDKPDQFYVPRGLLLFNELKPNLKKLFDKKSGRQFFMDLHQKNRCFFPEVLPNPDLIYASFRSSFVGRQFWKWDLITQVDPDYRDKLATQVTRNDLESFIYRN